MCLVEADDFLKQNKGALDDGRNLFPFDRHNKLFSNERKTSLRNLQQQEQSR